MKWSWRVGQFWGAEIRLHASLLLLIPYAVLAFKPDNLSSFLRVLLLLGALFASVILHEMGHTLAARLYGIPVTSIVLWPLGGYTSLSRRPTRILPDVVISASGPLVNLLIAIILGLATAAERLVEDTQVVPTLSRVLWQADVFPFLATLTLTNLALAIFNLVPVYPLDGGQIARDMLKGIFGEQRADFIMLILSLPAALALTAAGIIFSDIAILLTGVILLLACVTLNLRLFSWLSLGMLYIVDRPEYYLRAMDYDQAIQQFSRIIQRAPDRAGAYLSRAVAAMNICDLAAARADIDRALALDADNPTTWTLHGELLGLDKNNAAALAAYNRAIELRPTFAIAYLDRATSIQEQGDPLRSLDEMNKGVELGRGSPVGYLLRSRLRFEMGDIEGSHQDADQALLYAPQYMLIFSEIFLTNMAGHLDWALDYFWRAINRMPNAYQAYQGRGDACRVNQHPDWAIADYNRAIHLAPKQAEIYLARGRAYQQIGELEKAAADYRDAVQWARRAHIRRLAGEALAEITPDALSGAAAA